MLRERACAGLLYTTNQERARGVPTFPRSLQGPVPENPRFACPALRTRRAAFLSARAADAARPPSPKIHVPAAPARQPPPAEFGQASGSLSWPSSVRLIPTAFGAWSVVTTQRVAAGLIVSPNYRRRGDARSALVVDGSQAPGRQGAQIDNIRSAVEPSPTSLRPPHPVVGAAHHQSLRPKQPT